MNTNRNVPIVRARLKWTTGQKKFDSLMRSLQRQWRLRSIVQVPASELYCERVCVKCISCTGLRRCVCVCARLRVLQMPCFTPTVRLLYQVPLDTGIK